jgi:hypothetical protein
MGLFAKKFSVAIFGFRKNWDVTTPRTLSGCTTFIPLDLQLSINPWSFSG